MLDDYEITQKEYNEKTHELLKWLFKSDLYEAALEELDCDAEYFENLVEFEGA